MRPGTGGVLPWHKDIGGCDGAAKNEMLASGGAPLAGPRWLRNGLDEAVGWLGGILDTYGQTLRNAAGWRHRVVLLSGIHHGHVRKLDKMPSSVIY